MPRLFFNHRNAATELRISTRQLMRIAIRADIEPLTFEGGLYIRYFWSREQLERLRSFLRPSGPETAASARTIDLNQ